MVRRELPTVRHPEPKILVNVQLTEKQVEDMDCARLKAGYATRASYLRSLIARNVSDILHNTGTDVTSHDNSQFRIESENTHREVM